MKQIVPEIYVRDCAEALGFYKDTFGGEIKNLQMSDDMEMFKEHKHKVVHAELHVNNKCIFYFVDIFDPKRAEAGNVTLMLHMQTKLRMLQVYEALSKGGVVSMAMQKTYCGEYHAIVTDRYGAPWALNYAPKKARAMPVA